MDLKNSMEESVAGFHTITNQRSLQSTERSPKKRVATKRPLTMHFVICSVGREAVLAQDLSDLVYYFM